MHGCGAPSGAPARIAVELADIVRLHGEAFRRTHVLTLGGSVDYMELFVRFRGRRPDPSALLRQAGIA